MKIGFIGLGHMGTGMAARLLEAGHEVTVYNRTSAKTAVLTAQGASGVRSIAEACRGDAVVTMLANDDAVKEVVLGKGGILASLPKGALHVSSSTIGVTLSERLTAAHADAGLHFVAAPVFGRPDAAAAGQLFIAAAGEPSAVKAAAPILDAMGQRTFVVSETPSAANLIKLSGNFLSASVIESLGEAVALVAKAGVDPHCYIEFLTSSIFNVPVFKIYGGLIADNNFKPASFAAPLGQKDIRLTLAAADALDVPMPIANILRDRFLALMAHGGENLDWAAIGGLASIDAALASSRTAASPLRG